MKNPIIVFQEKNGLVADGSIGPLTMKTMCTKWNKTHTQVSHFLGQTSHESADFTRLIENLNYSAQGLANTFPTRYAVDYRAKIKIPNALALKLANNKIAIANNVYANRMGNGPESSGDGWLHRGYGPIQLTGKANHYAFADYVKDPAIKTNPALIAEKYALESALFFFDKNNIWKYAVDLSDDSIDKVSDAINRGNPFAKGYAIGYKDRKERTLKFSKIK